MAVTRKTNTGKAKPAVIEAKATTVSVSEPVVSKAAAEFVAPAMQGSLDATLSKAEELHEQVRLAAEQSVEKSKVVFEKLKAAAEDASASVETSVSTLTRGVSAINLKALDAIKANSDAHFAFVKALLAATTISEAITLHGEHAKSQFETLNMQAKELAALLQQVSADTVEPIKATLTKTLHVAA